MAAGKRVFLICAYVLGVLDIFAIFFLAAQRWHEYGAPWLGPGDGRVLVRVRNPDKLIDAVLVEASDRQSLYIRKVGDRGGAFVGSFDGHVELRWLSPGALRVSFLGTVYDFSDDIEAPIHGLHVFLNDLGHPY
jgi:hypothetical protein